MTKPVAGRHCEPRRDEAISILIIRLDHLGDILMNWPAIRALRNSYPNAKIDVLISKESVSLFEGISGFNFIPIQHHWFSRNFDRKSSLNTWFWLLRQIRLKKYDLGIDFRGDLRHLLLLFLGGVRYRLGYGITGGGFLLSREISFNFNLHQVLSNLRLLQMDPRLKTCGDDKLSSPNFSVGDPGSELPYGESKKHEVWKKFGKYFEGPRVPRILIHASAGYPSKRWPVENFQKLIERIFNAGLGKIYLIGSQMEKEMMYLVSLRGAPIGATKQSGFSAKIHGGSANSCGGEKQIASPPSAARNDDSFIDLRGETSLSELAILMAECDIFIGNDSGPAHLAALQGMRGVVIFSGTNDAKVWRPWSDKIQVIQHTVPCSPCSSQECPLTHHDCMRKISVDDIYQEINSLLCHPERSEGSQILRTSGAQDDRGVL